MSAWRISRSFVVGVGSSLLESNVLFIKSHSKGVWLAERPSLAFSLFLSLNRLVQMGKYWGMSWFGTNNFDSLNFSSTESIHRGISRGFPLNSGTILMRLGIFGNGGEVEFGASCTDDAGSGTCWAWPAAWRASAHLLAPLCDCDLPRFAEDCLIAPANLKHSMLYSLKLSNTF